MKRPLLVAWPGKQPGSRPRHRVLRCEPLEGRYLLAANPILSEFLADNESQLADEDGEFSDWIEIYNAGDEPADLEGWFLTDDAEDLGKWEFPPTTLPAGGFLTVFASDKDRRGTGPGDELHTNFRLDGAGEFLALVRPDGLTTVTQFAPAYPPQKPDISFGIGQSVRPDKLIGPGEHVAVLVPDGDDDAAIGDSWQGNPIDEPFDDSAGAGWIQASGAIGYDTGQLIGPPTGTSTTVGASLINRNFVDINTGSVFMLQEFPFNEDATLTDWSIYSDTAGTLTPLILFDTGSGFDVAGIGTTRVTDGSGRQDFPLDLVSGSADVGAGYFFAWKDGTAQTNQSGVIDYQPNTGDDTRWFGQQTNIDVGGNLGTGFVVNRTYSVRVTYFVPDEGGTPGTTADAGAPVGYWNFDGTLEDASGGGHTAQLQGATYSNETPGDLGGGHLSGGQSLQFDGAGDFVKAEIDVSETSYTASLWFRAGAASRGIFAVVDGDLGGGGHDRHIYLNGGNVATRVWSDETIASTGANYADGNWHHVAHVVGGEVGGQRIYVDGQLVATGAKAASDFDWQQAIHIGFSNDAASGYFSGWIDDVAVFDEALSEAQVQALASGALPLALAGFRPLIQTDLETEMHGASASAYARIAFEASLPVDFEGLSLRVKYDDGFVAYLGGVEVARRNAPQDLSFDSTATVDREVSDAISFEDIDLSAHIGRLREGTNILSLHALNDAPDSPNFLLGVELVKVDTNANRYMLTPTPGAQNALGVVDFVADTKFSVDRGFFAEPISVEITTETEGAQIYFTTDGSEPAPDNPAATLYGAPVSVTTTTTLRAAAFKEDFEPTNVDTQTYLFIADVANQPVLPPGVPSVWSGGFAADYQVDPDVVRSTLPGYSLEEALLSIPSVSVTTAPENLFNTASGIYANSEKRGSGWERPASIELIQTDGSEGFQIDAGIRMHGNSSRIHGFTPKHPIRIMFKSQYGAAKLNFPVFGDRGVDRFDQLLLRGASTDSWPVVDGNFVLGVQRWNPDHATYLRDQWMRDAQLAMGQPSADGIYVHLYLNGLYWGLYNLAERPTDSFNAEHLGGEKEEYDVIKDFAELQSGSRDAWDAMIALASAGLASAADYQKIQGNNPDGTPNANLPNYLDVDNLIDYMILHIASGAEDWPDHNWWAARRRGPESEGFKFFVWDQEIANDSLVRTHTRIQTRFEDPIGTPSPSFLYGKLMENPTFRQTFIDRVQLHLFNGGVLSPEANQARWMQRQSEIDLAMVGESARWGDSKQNPPYRREVEWINEMNWMRDAYWPQNHALAVERFRRVGLYPNTEAPYFEVDGNRQHGGTIAPQESLELIQPASGANVIETPLVAADNPVSAYVPTSDALGDSWHLPTFVENAAGETWLTGNGGVGYENNIGYDDVIDVDVGADMTGAGGNNSVYVRLPFTVASQQVIDQLDKLVLRISYDDGFVAYLGGVRVAGANAPSPESLSWQSGATAAHEASIGSPSETDITSFKQLLQVGENVLAIHGLNTATNSSDMLILARLIAGTIETDPAAGTIFYTLDGSDPMDPGAVSYDGPIHLNESAVVRARSIENAQWSALTRALFVVETPLRVTEIMYNPLGSEDATEFIELTNVHDTATVDLAGVTISGIGDYQFLETDARRFLSPGEQIVIVRDLAAFGAAYPEVPASAIADRPYIGALDNGGETITLRDPAGGEIQRFRYDDKTSEGWYDETDGGGFSLVVVDAAGDSNDPANWRSSALSGGSPGAADPTPVVGDLDGDGTTTRSDAAIVLRNLGRTGQSHRGTGDIDGDQATTLADLALIQWNLGSTIAPSTPAPSTPAPSTPVPSALAATLPAPSAAPPDSIPRQTVRAAADRIVSHSDSPHASELPERIRWTRARRIVRTRPAPAIDRALDTVLNHHIPAAPRRARIEEVRSESVSR